VANIFVSYTKSDRNWAFWIAQELERLGHVPHVHEWEISAGGNIASWMEKRLNEADHVLCIISREYLNKSFSSWERQSGEWAAAAGRENFVLPVFVEDCVAPLLLSPLKRCDLFGIGETEARQRLVEYLTPAGKPDGEIKFPVDTSTSNVRPLAQNNIPFPGGNTSSYSIRDKRTPDLNNRVSIFTAFRPLEILNAAISAVPSVKYALGTAGIAAAAAIMSSFVGGYSRISIISIGLVIIGMFVLFLFSVLITSGSGAAKYAGIALMWAVTVFVIAFMVFTTTAVATGYPCNWAEFLTLRTACQVAEANGYRSPTSSADPVNPQYDRLTEITRGTRQSLCAAEKTGSKVQLFERGWLLYRFD
jgi:TIR domain